MSKVFPLSLQLICQLVNLVLLFLEHREGQLVVLLFLVSFIHKAGVLSVSIAHLAYLHLLLYLPG